MNIFKFFFLFSLTVLSQTEISGVVLDSKNFPVPFANVYFKDSYEGTTTNDKGEFKLSSTTNYNKVSVSFLGYKTLEADLDTKRQNLIFVLEDEQSFLNDVVITVGKTSKKNNPAIDLLRKVWSNKKRNGLNLFDQYKYDFYEKVEFDMNSIDSTFMNRKMFKGIEFVFDNIDTSKVTGKTYLPVFINESFSEVYGDNVLNKNKTILKGNKNSGFNNNHFVIDFVDDLYSDYNIYENYLKIFDKSFVSPLSRTGINVYNYVLVDSSFIDSKWCYNISFYPRRKNELTFKGDIWINDSTYAVKKFNMQTSKNANINWVKDIYIEQEFEVANDSVFLLKRDYFLSDFAISKKEKSKGMFGKRTTIYDNFEFNNVLNSEFYEDKVDEYDEALYNKEDSFWKENRLEKLNNEELGIYKMLDTLQSVKKFKSFYTLGATISSGYFELDKLNLDLGPITSFVGNNDVEGLRLRVGARTYVNSNDKSRAEFFTAYGLKDNKFKYGLSFKTLLNKKNRFIAGIGYRNDVEQIGVDLTSSTDILGRSFASNALFGVAPNDKLTKVKILVFSAEVEAFKNLVFKLNIDHRDLKSASDSFSLDYFNDESSSGISSNINQVFTSFSMFYTPKRKQTGYGVERSDVNSDYPTFFIFVGKGVKGLFNSDFDYTKLQFSYSKPFKIGGLGRLYSTVKAGKIFNEVPLGLLSVIPGNQSYNSVFNNFSLINYYEFITDSYLALNLEHNFNGRLFSRFPLIRDLNLREIVGFKSVLGSISDKNVALNASDINYISPSSTPYYEYYLGVGNIFKFFRVDFNFRGNYLDMPESRSFGVTGAFGFTF